MKKDMVNIGASVRARLLNRAKETGRPFAEVMQYYGMERFLYREIKKVSIFYLGLGVYTPGLFYELK